MNNAVPRWRVFALCLLLLAGTVSCAYALIVSLDVYVEFGLLDENGNPLTDGMTVLVMGSTDPFNDGMALIGSGPTNYIAESALNDDVLLATVTISSNESGVAGGFFATITYDSDEINFVYIRFFNAPPGSLTGMIYWGTSSVVQLGVTLGVSTVSFDSGGQLQATNYNNFVVIPEPSTVNLFVMMAGVLWAMRSHVRKRIGADSAVERE
ncbi:MAG TPA: hypothetical protein PKC67_14330 [Kiritimatiellia bacterium]|nr:hypothetical protein [Kiritimatiellia bacterium]HMP35513.1 hypothetical protein [Kiritimatiellia bacterium]